MPSGGKREGAGRKNGSVGHKWARTLAFYRERYAVMPLDHMLEVLNAPLSKEKGITHARKDEMAKTAAPYLHPRLMAKHEPDQPVRNSIDLTKLTDEELIAFEKIVIKAQRPVLPPPLLGFDAEDE